MKSSTWRDKVREVTRRGNQEDSLNLNSDDMRDEGAKLVADALTNENNKVIELHLCTNNIGVEGAKAIADSLKHANNKVAWMYLGMNHIGDEGVKYVADALKNVNNKVTTLGLSSNNIGVEGAKYVADALKHANNKVTALYLGRNMIGDEGAKAIANALKNENNKVTMLDLSLNKFGEEGAKAIADALNNENNKVTLLNLYLNKGGGGAIADALQQANCKVTRYDMQIVERHVPNPHLEKVRRETEILMSILEKSGISPSRSTAILDILAKEGVDLGILVNLDHSTLRSMNLTVGEADKILKSARQAIESELRQRQANVAALSLKITKLDQAVEESTVAVVQSKRRLQQKKQQIQDLQVQIKRLQDQVTSGTASLTKLTTQYETCEQRLHTIRSQKAERTAELEDMMQSVSSLQAAMVRDSAAPGTVKVLTEERDFEKAVATSLSTVQSELQRALDSERDLTQCRICCESRISKSFQCGHTFCGICAERISRQSPKRCPSCRAPVVAVNQLFL